MNAAFRINPRRYQFAALLSSDGEGWLDDDGELHEFDLEHPYWEFITQAERDKAAKAGEAMPDGSYPIRNGGELDKAIKAVGRGNADHDTIRKHVIKRAKALGQSNKIPDNWNADGSLKKASAENVEGMTAALGDAPPEGAWHAYIFVEGLRTTDGRAANVDAGTWRDLPLPISWQQQNEHGHKSSVVVGAMETIERQAKDGYSVLYATGTWDLDSPDGAECARQVALQGGVRTVSGDIEPLDVDLCSGSTGEPIDDFFDAIMNGEDFYEVLTEYRVGGVTVVSIPAFPQCLIAPASVALEDVEPLGQQASEPEPIPMPMMVASAVDVREGAAPSSWFARPALDRLTALTVTDEGRVYGHIAGWGIAHTGYNGQRIYPPKNPSGNYPEFLTGEYPAEDGANVRVGQLTMGCGHAELSGVNRWQVKAHYDGGPGAVQAADVACGDDEFGIWVAGAIRPSLSAEQIREFRVLSPSGDWRRINGGMELLACVQVPAPGFPVQRSLVASAAGDANGFCRAHLHRADDETMEMTALVAAGRVVHDRAGDLFAALAQRVAMLEAVVEMAGLADQAADRLTASLG